MKKRRIRVLKEEKKLTLVGHLAELRKRIIYSAMVFILALGLCSFFVQRIVNEIIDVANNVKFCFIAPAELLMSYVKISVIGGLVISAPFLIFQLWSFVIPAVTKKEKRYILFSLLLGNVFFIAGVIFAYIVVLPTMLVFFIGFQTDAINAMISFNNYLNFVLSTVFTFGAVFELPILMMLLSRFGILQVNFLKKNRKYAILVIFIVAAIITPPDVISQIILAGPMILLFEIGVFLSSLAEKKKKKDTSNVELITENVKEAK